MKIIIPGGSGQVGTILARAFHGEGHEVVVLSRSPRAASWKTLAWDAATRGDWWAQIDGADVVINLAGRSVNCRYHAANRREIMQSRVDSTRAVGDAIAAAKNPQRRSHAPPRCRFHLPLSHLARSRPRPVCPLAERTDPVAFPTSLLQPPEASVSKKLSS